MEIIMHQRVIDFLKNKGIEFRTAELKEVPRSAKDVERIYGVPLNQILKSLLFKGTKDDKKAYIYLILQGDKRASFAKIEEKFGIKNLELTTPDEVKTLTGHPIGGLSPFSVNKQECDERSITKVLDSNCLDIEELNMGSGTAEIGIIMKSSALKDLWDGEIEDISE